MLAAVAMVGVLVAAAVPSCVVAQEEDHRQQQQQQEEVVLGGSDDHAETLEKLQAEEPEVPFSLDDFDEIESGLFVKVEGEGEECSTPVCLDMLCGSWSCRLFWLH